MVYVLVGLCELILQRDEVKVFFHREDAVKAFRDLYIEYGLSLNDSEESYLKEEEGEGFCINTDNEVHLINVK